MGDRIDAGAIGRLVEHSDEFSGVVLVQQGERVLHRSAVGLANRTWQIPNRVDTRFRVGSVSKLFTAVAVLQLVEQGRVRLDDSLADLLALDEIGIPPEVTIGHLLSMTGGIADWFDESGDWAANWAALIRQHPIYLLRANADYLPLFAGKPALFPPGERYQYNGAGYILLGMVVERVSDTPYPDHVVRQVLEPAGMTRSGFVALDGVEPEVAEGYLPIPDDDGAVTGWRKNIYSTTPEAAADGGATATAADLVAFLQALRSGKLLTEATTRQMLAPRVRERDEQVRGYTWMYGYGVMSILNDAGHAVRWGHTGEEDGVSCRLYHYPDHDLDVALLGNASWCAAKLAWDIHDVIMR
ncbi:serine hydrolase domain-containing protein [Actinopolymorpha alba]|uniref:serine hydrolase domain-containing protein n=1 Tax=Actinopolymorpha alba TaxID=533267 RepID=UPI00037D8CEF|nr:serine hydrolase domain-containing protein [Actinopolymorpha alba]